MKQHTYENILAWLLLLLLLPTRFPFYSRIYTKYPFKDGTKICCSTEERLETASISLKFHFARNLLMPSRRAHHKYLVEFVLVAVRARVWWWRRYHCAKIYCKNLEWCMYISRNFPCTNRERVHMPYLDRLRRWCSAMAKILHTQIKKLHFAATQIHRPRQCSQSDVWWMIGKMGVWFWNRSFLTLRHNIYVYTSIWILYLLLSVQMHTQLWVLRDENEIKTIWRRYLANSKIDDIAIS